MNSQVLIDRELLETIIEQQITAKGFTSDAARQAQMILAAPIADAGELERLVTEQVKHAYYERKTITEAVGEIVSALQASTMVVPDGLTVKDRSFIFISSECTLPTLLVSFKHNDWDARDKFAALLAASPAPGDSQ